MAQRRMQFGKLAGACLLLLVPGMVPAAESIPVIPLPAKVQAATGSFVISRGTPIVVAKGDVAAIDAARQFAAMFHESHGWAPEIIERRPRAHLTVRGIHFQTDRSAPEKTGAYNLRVDGQVVRVGARDPAGLFYGGVTLWQLATATQGDEVRLQAVEIQDAPRFGWRGFMLDSARHMQGVDDIKRLLDQMARHKLNVFHWHLTDDQGWRLEIKRYPRLTQVGGWRVPAGAAGRNVDGSERRYGGWYTQDQAREIVAYAAARHITVVPEIEMPGHAQAAIAAYPELGMTGKAPPVSPDWGVHPYLYNVDDATFTFLQNVLDETMAIFPGRYIHVGGDEAVKDQWQASAAIQAKRKALGLADDMALQSWFIKRVERYLASHGRRLIGWDEILEGGLPADATVMSWRGTKGAVEAAREGHDVVLSPSDVTYLNRMQSDAVDEPPSHDYPTPLRAVYDFEPVPPGLSAAQERHVLGAQANLWTEHVRTVPRVEHMAFPRLAALAEGVWTPRADRQWDSFLQRLAPQMARYAKAGVQAADSAFAVDIRLQPAGHDRARVMLSNQVDFGEIRYTTDGSEPNPESALYSGDFELAMPADVIARTFHDGQPLAATRRQPVTLQALRTRPAERLQTCKPKGLTLRLEDDAPVEGNRAVLQVDIMDACWIWPQAELDGIGGVRANVANLPYNFQLGGDIAKVKVRPAATPAGEFVVRRDSCTGPVIASASLAQARRNDGITSLRASMPRTTGRHDLCFQFTGHGVEPLWALDEVELLPVD